MRSKNVGFNFFHCWWFIWAAFNSIWSSDLILHHITWICDYFATHTYARRTNKICIRQSLSTYRYDYNFVKCMSLNGVDKAVWHTVSLTSWKMQLQNMVINWKFSASLQMAEELRSKSGGENSKCRKYLAAMI